MATRLDTERHHGFGTHWGASLIRFHLQNADICDEDRADLAALADSLDGEDDRHLAVWRFAKDFARTSGDSPGCNCVTCRAYRATRDDMPVIATTPAPTAPRRDAVTTQPEPLEGQ